MIYRLSLCHLLHQQTHHRFLNTKIFYCRWVLQNLNSTRQRWKSGKCLIKLGKMRCSCTPASCNMLLPLGREECIPAPRQCHRGRQPTPQKSTSLRHQGLSRERASPLALCSAGMKMPVNLKCKSSGLKEQKSLLFALNYNFPQKSARRIPIKLRVTMLTDRLRWSRQQQKN